MGIKPRGGQWLRRRACPAAAGIRLSRGPGRCQRAIFQAVSDGRWHSSRAGTVRGYLVALLAALWHHGEGFKITVKGSAANGRPVKAAGNGTCTGALVKARLAGGTTGDNGFAGGIPPASKNKAHEMIAFITGAPGGH
jgi:hypothetical protein